jgi:branched-chain amino acid transport system permease protein
VIFKLMQDWIANLTPQYWQFWIGLVLVLIVLVGRDRVGLWTGGVRVLAERLTRRLAPGAQMARGSSATLSCYVF